VGIAVPRPPAELLAMAGTFGSRPSWRVRRLVWRPARPWCVVPRPTVPRSTSRPGTLPAQRSGVVTVVFGVCRSSRRPRRPPQPSSPLHVRADARVVPGALGGMAVLTAARSGGPNLPAPLRSRHALADRGVGRGVGGARPAAVATPDRPADRRDRPEHVDHQERLQPPRRGPHRPAHGSRSGAREPEPGPAGLGADREHPGRCCPGMLLSRYGAPRPSSLEVVADRASPAARRLAHVRARRGCPPGTTARSVLPLLWCWSLRP